MNDPMARGGVRRYLDTVKPEEYLPVVGEVNLAELSLTGLADLYGSDKGSIKHRYTEIYEALVNRLLNGRPRKSTSLQIVEAGVACGASLRMWSNYLPASHITGYDVRADCGALCKDLSNVSIKIADPATDVQAGAARLDLFVDDASHISEQIVAMFQNCWAWVKPGGYYVIEDLRCTYDANYTANFRKHFDANAVNDRRLILGLMDTLMRMVDARDQIAEISYHPQLLIMRKKPD
jgi:hypothetical protein